MQMKFIQKCMCSDRVYTGTGIMPGS